MKITMRRARSRSQSDAVSTKRQFCHFDVTPVVECGMRSARAIEPFDRPMQFFVRTYQFEGRGIPRLAAWQDDGEAAVLIMDLSPAMVHMAARSMGVDVNRVTIPPQRQLRDPQIEHIGYALKAELETDDPFGRVYAESLGVALAAHLLRKYAVPRAQPVTNDVSRRRLQRVMEYINENLSRDLSLVELAAIADVSASHLKTVFRNATGLPLHQYIIRLRVEYAVRLILGSELPLSEIAVIAGFSNQSHMARHTRRIIGTSPGALRER